MTFAAGQLKAPSIPMGDELAVVSTARMATATRERLQALDVLRAFALFGILVMNIEIFAAPITYHDFPHHGFAGLQGHLDLICVYIKWLFFRGKMRGLFSMLFGAGVILMTSRAERRGQGQNVADIYLRRNMLLCVFGLLHGLLIWEGDILFDYGLDALLFLYPCRKLAPKTLLILGTVLGITIGPFGLMGFHHTSDELPLSLKASPIEARVQAGLPLTEEQQKTEQAWQDMIEKNRFHPEKAQENITEKLHQTYFGGICDRMEELLGANFYSRHIDPMADTVSAMLLGMGLLRIGFLTGELPFITYLLTAIIGFGISIPLYLLALSKVFASDFDFIEMDKWLSLPYYFCREPAMLAITAVFVMIIKGGVLGAAQRAMAAVGQMALSNYLITSLICQFIFAWGPWKLYGQLEYYQTLYVVFGVWVINLVFSTLWMRSFSFGPFEWVWRSLTYGQAQPMRQRLLPASPQDQRSASSVGEGSVALD
jgi:uncharacterized protein